MKRNHTNYFFLKLKVNSEHRRVACIGSRCGRDGHYETKPNCASSNFSPFALSRKSSAHADLNSSHELSQIIYLNMVGISTLRPDFYGSRGGTEAGLE